ncbi:MAG: sensor histidine kinase [Candidatus Velamenicoccus archaeovorus]
MVGWLVVLGVIVLLAAIAAVVTSQRADHARRTAESLGRTVNALQRRLDELEGDRQATDTVLSSMEEGVVLVGSVGGIRLMNAAAERHLGVHPATLSGLRPTALQDAVRATSSDGRSRVVEVETGAPSRWLRGSAIAVGDGSVLLVVRDVTEARRIEEVRRDFVANASHELKTPVASIRAAAETIRTSAHEDPSVVTRFAQQLEREAVRLSRIVSDLLDLSRLEGGSTLEASVAMDALAREETERLAPEAREAGVDLTCSTAAVPAVRGSDRDLSLLVRNLVDNAIRYTRRGGRVDVSVEADDGRVVLTVADTGLGIPTRDLPRVFERFYRVDRARSRETGGTGLGLAIVKHVVENHGGTVDVTSELGHGSTFTVTLPAAPEGSAP